MAEVKGGPQVHRVASPWRPPGRPSTACRPAPRTPPGTSPPRGAQELDPTSPIDRAAASDAVGRYGHDVDATLATTYPGLLTTATPMTGDDAEARSHQARENTEALTAENAARTLRGDDVPGGLGDNEDTDREEAAIVRDGEATEHRGRAVEASSEVDRTRDAKVSAQFAPTCSQHHDSVAEKSQPHGSDRAGSDPDPNPRTGPLTALRGVVAPSSGVPQ